MTTTAPTTETGPRTRARGVRLAVFRTVMVLIALMHLVAFGAWRAILSPWVTPTDDVDHGWDRTPELHRLADGAAGLIFVAVAAAALVLAIKPLGRSGLAAWLAAALALTGGFAWASALVQGHDGVAGMILFSAVWLALVGAIFVWLHPEGREVVRGGASSDGLPGAVVSGLLTATVVASSLAVAVAVVWRLSGGVFESTQEDDVFGLVYVGLLGALGAVLARSGRAGWRPLALIVLAGAAYAVVGGAWVALG